MVSDKIITNTNLHTKTKNKSRHTHENKECLFCELDTDIIMDDAQGENHNPSRNKISKRLKFEKKKTKYLFNILHQIYFY